MTRKTQHPPPPPFREHGVHWVHHCQLRITGRSLPGVSQNQSDNISFTSFIFTHLPRSNKVKKSRLSAQLSSDSPSSLALSCSTTLPQRCSSFSFFAFPSLLLSSHHPGTNINSPPFTACVWFLSSCLSPPLRQSSVRCLIWLLVGVPTRGLWRGNQARFNHVRAQLCQLGGCQPFIKY